jgi:hypothetical protein
MESSAMSYLVLQPISPNKNGLENIIGSSGVGRLWTSLGQSPGLQMAWRRLPVFRCDFLALAGSGRSRPADSREGRK